MLNVQKYLIGNGLQRLQDEFGIEARIYPELCVLNYSQISSSKHHPIADECRGLILKLNTWEVIARSFQRFYNAGEDKDTASFPVAQARSQTKLDGSIMSVYFFNQEWHVSSRSMADAEGMVPSGKTFRDLFMEAASKTSLWAFLNESIGYQNFTWVFEITGLENRVVTIYPTNSITLIGARNRVTDKEVGSDQLDAYAKIMHVPRPSSHSCKTLEEVKAMAEALPILEEGFVLVYEGEDRIWRMKVKNSRYLAIAHLRGNGAISPKRVLKLVMENETEEYLQYFAGDKPAFDLTQSVYDDLQKRLVLVYEEHKGITVQKDFALAIIPQCKYGFESGVLFQTRKTGKPISQILMDVGADKITKAINLRGEFMKKLSLKVEEE